MSETAKGIAVAEVGSQVFVRVVGRGSFQNGQPLRRYALDTIDHGCRSITVDLAECQGMDSTFLGVLAGIGLRMAQGSRPGRIRITHAGLRNLELIETLGLNRLFTIEPATASEELSAVEFQRLPDSDIAELSQPLSKDDTADLMLEAHENLIRADQRNEAKFKDLTRFLRERGSQPEQREKNP